MNDLNFLLKLLKGELPPEQNPQTEILPEPVIEITQELPTMRSLNQSRQVPDLPSQPELMLNQGNVDTNGNGSGNLPEINGNVDIRRDIAFVSSIKAELEKAGLLTVPENQDEALGLAKLAQILQIGFKDKLAAACETSFSKERHRFSTIVSQMQQAPDTDTLFTVTVTEVRKHLQVDRALLYRFQDQDRGLVLAESVMSDYTPSLGETLAAQIFGKKDGQYQQQQIVAIEDIYLESLSPYQLQLLQQFQIKASLSLLIVLEGKVWGLLVVQQCSRSRQWQEAEINLLCQINSELTWRLQQAQLQTKMQRQAEQEKVIAKVIEKIQRSSDIYAIFRTATQELRHLLKADRVVISS